MQEYPEFGEPRDRLRLVDEETTTTNNPVPPTRKWANALSMIRQAADEMNATEARSKDIEARARAVLNRTLKELENAKRHIQAAEVTVKSAKLAERNAEKRAHEAEERAREAENMLERLHEEIVTNLINRPSESAEIASTRLGAA